MITLICRLFGPLSMPTYGNINDQARADWAAVKAAAFLLQSATHLAEVREAERAAHEGIADSYGHAAMRHPSAAVLNEFCAFAMAQVPHLVLNVQQ
jgi:hypothetical protein